MKIVESKNLENENIVKYYEYFDNEKEFVIVMELFDNDLDGYIRKRGKSLNIEEIYDILCQLNNTFIVMRKNKIYHGNINLNNILIKENKNKKLIFNLSSNFIGEIEDIFYYYNYVGVPPGFKFLAPEIIKGKEDFEKSDLWSLGILIYFLCFKEYPYMGNNKKQILLKIESLDICLKKTQNENLDDLIRKLLTVDINKRITWEEYFSHPFFNKN